MNIKFRINKWLESGLWWQLLLFTIINVVVFIICLALYFISGVDSKIGAWEALRLFVDSNGIIDHTHDFNGHNILLLLIECIGTILFSGMIVSFITNVINLRVCAIREGHVHYKLKDHIVIIGYDTIVPSIIAELIRHAPYANSKIVLQTSSSQTQDIRNDLLSKLPKKALRRLIVIHAPRQSIEELELLYTFNAREIYVVGERNLNDHDAENMYTFETLVSIHQKHRTTERKSLTIWFENEASYAALQLNDISKHWQQYFEFKPYNFYKRWANRLLISSNYGLGADKIEYPELDHKGIGADSSRHVHLIIIGMNRMGTALAKEAAHMMHFPNFRNNPEQNRTRITFIDDHADVEMNFFKGRHTGYFELAPTIYGDFTQEGDSQLKTIEPKANNFLDVQFEFIKGRCESNSVRNWIREQMKDDNAIITIAICIQNPSQSLGMAMYLPDEVYTRGRDNMSQPWNVVDTDKVVNIFVRQEKTGSLIKAFSNASKTEEAANKKYANLYPFGMVDDSFAIDYYSNHLAMAFNYIYDYYFAYNNTLPSCMPTYEELLDKWRNLSTANKWSNLYLADSIEFKLRSVGMDARKAQNTSLSQEQIDLLARTEHDRWNMEKLLIGYRAPREEEKNYDTKQLKKNLYIHPLIKPYDDLSTNDKQLDLNIIQKLPAILRMLD